MSGASNRRSVPDRWANGSDESKRLVQCPACWTAAMAQADVDWECECGELMTVVDLRASNVATTPKADGWFANAERQGG